MRLGQWVLAGAITLVLAAIVHLGTVLAVPYTGPRDAWARLSDMMHEGEVTVLPAARPGEEILPELDPNLVYGVCPYDVSEGPFAVSTEVPASYWAISLQTPQGNVFYAVDNEAAIEGAIDIELRTPEAMRRYQLAVVEEEAERVLAVEAPTRTGHVLIRALVSRGTQREEIEAMLRETFCGTIEETVVPEEPLVEPESDRPYLPVPPDRPDELTRD